MLRHAAWCCFVASGCSSSPVGSPVAPATSISTSAQSFAVERGDIAITDVSVVPISSAGVLEHHTVVVRGDRIVAVAPRASLALPDEIEVIDGAGKWLIPGLADMHVHAWSDDELTMFVAAGVTTIRNMWGTPRHLAWRSQIERGERLGPTIVTAGPLIDGPSPDWPGSVVLADPGAAEPLVAAQRAAGYDFLKPVGRLSREAYDALAAAGARHGMPLAGHVPTAAGLDGALAARQRSIEHLDGYLAALVPAGPPLPSPDDIVPWLRAVLARLDPSRLPGLIDRTIAAGTWNCPTLIATDRVPELHDVAAIERRVRWLHLVPTAVRARWARDFGGGPHPADEVATYRAANAQDARTVAALAAANAPLLVGTDSGGGYVIAGESLLDEIELMVAAGVPRPQVLRAATADAWRFLGQPHEAGVVEVGARADLVLVTNDPLTTPLPLLPDGVMVRGRWLPRQELEAKLAEVAAHAAPPRDRWHGAPPLAATGRIAQRAHYDLSVDGAASGQERLVVAEHAGERTVTGEIADFGNEIETAYHVAGDRASITTTYHTMKLDLRAQRRAGQLIVTGTDLSGKPVSLREPVAPGAFLSAPGVGGSQFLVAKLADMAPRARRRLRTVELEGFPAIAIVSARYKVERRPDRGGHRVFALTTTQRETTVTGELVVDATGGIVEQTFGPPEDTRASRR